MKKHDEIIQGLEGLWGKAPLPADFEDVVSTPMTAGQDRDYDELEEFKDDKERQEARDVIQSLEGLWGKAPLPADFEDAVSTTDSQQSSPESGSSRVVFMKDYRKRRELLHSSISLGSVLAACLVLVLSWSLKDSAVDNTALADLTEAVRENAMGNAAVTGLTTKIREQQKALRDATYKLAWVTNELARDRSAVLQSGFDPELVGVKKATSNKIRDKFVLAAKHFEQLAALETDRAVRTDITYDTAWAYLEACDFEDAATLLREVVNEGGGKKHGKAESLFYLGAIFHMSKDYIKAISEYKEAIEQAGAEALERPQGSDSQQESESLQEMAAFNLALMHAALFAESREPQHLEDTLTALKQSIDIGGRERLIRVQEIQAAPETDPNPVCPGYPWVEDLGVVAKEPAFGEFLEEQLNRRWL